MNKIKSQCEIVKETWVIVNFDGDTMNHHKEYGWLADRYEYLEFSTRKEADDYLLIFDQDDKFNVWNLEDL